VTFELEVYMLSVVTTTTPAAASKSYKFLVRELAPPVSVHHAGKHSLFAEFVGITFSIKDNAENPEEVVLSLHLHATTNVETTAVYHKTAKKIASFTKKEIDTLNPFL